MPGGATAQSTNSEAATKARGNPSGPFGFEYGMTREEIIKLIGKQAVKENNRRHDGRYHGSETTSSF